MASAMNELLTDLYKPCERPSASAIPGLTHITESERANTSKLLACVKHFDLLTRLLTPGDLSPRLVFIVSILSMETIAFFNLVAPPEIRLHILYLFPLAAVALHCERLGTTLAGLALSVAFQLWNYFSQDFPSSNLVTDGLITAAASMLTVALARASRANFLATMSLAATDWLTGLYNRRSFETAADNEISRQRRYGGVFSMAVIDLDGFKKLNDSKGHHTGDLALKLVADVLREQTRETDLVARLGGDEFVVLMPNTPAPACLSLSQQFAAIIASRMFCAGFGVTASIGCTSFEDAPESTPAALQKADLAMYAAKAGGKARAVFV